MGLIIKYVCEVSLGKVKLCVCYLFRYLLRQTLRNDPVYGNQVIIPEQSERLPLNWGNCDACEDCFDKIITEVKCMARCVCSPQC